MVRLVCGRESRFRLGLSRAHSLTFIDKNDKEFIKNEQNHDWILIMGSLPNNLRGTVAQIESKWASPSSKSFHAFDQTLTLILKCLRNIEKSMIRKTQIFNFHSGDPNIFFEKTSQNFELMVFYSPWVVFL